MIKKKELSSSKVERQIISQMILNTDFLRKINEVYERDIFKLNYVNTVAELCVDYFKDHDKAPGKHIQDLYESIVRIDPEQKELIKKFLISIDKDLHNYEPDKLYNTEFHFEIARDHLTGIRIERKVKEVSDLLAGKEYEKAEAIFKGYESIRHDLNPAMDALSDKSFISDSFDISKSEVLFQIPGLSAMTTLLQFFA